MSENKRPTSAVSPGPDWPLTKIIAQLTDEWSFMLWQLGVAAQAKKPEKSHQ